jgi:hypothetical protein
MPPSLAGVSVLVLRPAVTARPSGEPCEVRMRRSTSVLGLIDRAAVCRAEARVPVVASAVFPELNRTITGSAANLFATPASIAANARRQAKIVAAR